MASSNIIEKVNEYLIRDLESIFLPPCVKDPKKISKTKSSRRHFASYLVSVVTHPIGLRASISPYNASLESMLAYLMEMLMFSETQLKKMLIKEHLEDFKSTNQEAGPTVTAFKKRHSWRPELRVRVRPPVFYQAKRSHSQLDHLTVRIYLFKETAEQQADATSLTSILKKPLQQSPVVDSAGKNFLEAFRKSRLHSASLIRPISEMRYELKFQREGTGDVTSYKTIIVRDERGRASNTRKNGKDDDKQSPDDIYLKIRRYYCDHKSPTYILRLEFWIKNSGTSGVGYLRRFARSLVHNNPLCCKCAGRRPATVYSAGNKSLYGFTNVKICQVPAYAARTSHPILNMRESQVNTCELITDIKNRRLDSKGTGNKSREFIIQHLRLYAYCVSHQLASMMMIVKPTGPSGGPSLNELEGYLQSNMTLDNLLYLPAYAIINQHRLQGNMSALEDQSLRRSALLMLLLQLDKLSPKATPTTAPIEACKLLVMAMTQHEYSVAHRPFDSRTMQEVDPFGLDTGADADDHVREIVLDVEEKTIQSLVDEYLAAHRLKRWLSALNSLAGTSLDKMVTLGCLRLVRCICDYNQINQLTHVKLASQAMTLEARTNRLLSVIVTDELSRKLMEAFKETPSPQREVKSPSGSKTQPGSPVGAPPMQPVDSWRRLLENIQVIENDLSLYWSGERGLELLEIDVRKSIQEKKQTKQENNIDFKELIEHKMNRFLTS